ncbi:MAG TPA: hypothetical protein VHA33_17855 [Candidatus Angelobacter sp.]|jgi:hypothetical protein|nr:hypothetical protein [Candidatus Angelobacter sp.]
MENQEETTYSTTETQPDLEMSKKPAQAIDDKAKPNTLPTVVPNPQDKEHKEPEKKSA